MWLQFEHIPLWKSWLNIQSNSSFSEALVSIQQVCVLASLHFFLNSKLLSKICINSTNFYFDCLEDREWVWLYKFRTANNNYCCPRYYNKVDERADKQRVLGIERYIRRHQSRTNNCLTREENTMLEWIATAQQHQYTLRKDRNHRSAHRTSASKWSGLPEVSIRDRAGQRLSRGTEDMRTRDYE